MYNMTWSVFSYLYIWTTSYLSDFLFGSNAASKPSMSKTMHRPARMVGIQRNGGMGNIDWKKMWQLSLSQIEHNTISYNSQRTRQSKLI